MNDKIQPKRSATFAFVEGTLTIRVEGFPEQDGWLCVVEDDIHWNSEEGKSYAEIHFEATELVDLRNFLTKYLGAPST